MDLLAPALAGCDLLNITTPGQPPATLTITNVPPPPAAPNSVTFEATVVAGHARGFQFTQVVTGIADTVVTLSYVNTPQTDLDSITKAALQHAARSLGAAPPT